MKRSTLLALMIVCAGVPVGFALNGDLSGKSDSDPVHVSQGDPAQGNDIGKPDPNENTSSDLKRSEKTIREGTISYSESSTDSDSRSGSMRTESSRSGRDANRSIDIGQRVTDVAAENSRWSKIGESDLANPDAAIRQHFEQALTTFNPEKPSLAADHFDQGVAILEHEVAANNIANPGDRRDIERDKDSSAAASSMTSSRSSEERSTKDTGEQSVKSEKSKESRFHLFKHKEDKDLTKTDKEFRNLVQDLEKFNTKLAEGKVKDADDLKEKVNKAYSELASYHYAMAHEIASLPSGSYTEPRGSAITNSQIDSSTRAWGNNASSEQTDRQARHTPSYHMQQAAEYLNGWSKVSNHPLDADSTLILERYSTIDVNSGNAIEDQQYTEFGTVLDRNGIRVEKRSERSSSQSSTTRNSDGSMNRSSSEQSSSNESSTAGDSNSQSTSERSSSTERGSSTSSSGSSSRSY